MMIRFNYRVQVVIAMTIVALLQMWNEVLGFSGDAYRRHIQDSCLNQEERHVNPNHRQRDFKLMSVTTASLERVNEFYETMPYAAAFVTCGFKASAADILAQRSQVVKDNLKNKVKAIPNHVVSGKVAVNVSSLNEKSSFDLPRNGAFIAYGGLYQGIVQEYIFNHLYPFFFGTGTDLRTVLIKVTFDMLVVSPFLCLPVAYLIKGIILKTSLSESIDKYVKDVMYKGLLL